MFKRQKQQQQIRKGNNRWADDDEDTSNNTNNIPSKTNINTPSFIKTSNYPNSNSTNNKPINNNSNNYQPSSNKPKKDTRFALEKKLIDDILQPTGIKIKPDEKLMIDFCRRAKNLDRTLIYSYLMEKISPYRSYIGNNEQTNMLIKCLYLISYIIDSKIQDLFEVFSDNQQIFIDIKSSFGTNRKISELTEQILQFLGVEVKNENDNNDYQNFENNDNNNNNENEKNQKEIQATNNINLLEDIFQNDGIVNNNNPQNNNTNDLLGGIFGTNEINNNINNVTNNSNINNNFPSDIFGAPSQNVNQINNQNSFFENIQQNTNNQTTNQVSNQPKGFDFIKKGDTSNINNAGNQNKPPAKKGFPFIKQTINSTNNSNVKQAKENDMMNNDLGNIFINAPQSSTPQQNFNQGFNVNQLENIFNLQSNDNTKTNNNPEPKIPTLVAQKPEFNINQVYQNTTQLQKELKPNDPFNFVDDLFKKK